MSPAPTRRYTGRGHLYSFHDLDLLTAMPSFVTHLESALDGMSLSPDVPQTLHRDRPLWVRYDLAAVRQAVSRSALAGREPSMWRYRELLPYASEEMVVSLGETITPLVPCPRLGARFG